jgi:transposase-like protein
MQETKLTASEEERYDIIRACIDRDITNQEASVKLGVNKRQVQRLKRRVESNGKQGVVHGLKGHTAHNATNEKIRKKITTFFKNKKRADFGPTFAQEKLMKDKVTVNRETLRLIMVKEDIWKVKKRRGSEIHRDWRERKDTYGEMIQFDGSYHDWLENGQEQCLLGAIDDATSDIVNAIFEDNEGVRAVFRFWRAYVEAHGRPGAIYLDKFSTYKVNHLKAEDNANFLTQFERAMKTLDIKVICANSPEAKGRVERLFGTLQDRLVKEMRLVDAKCQKEANAFLTKTYIKDHNKRFGVKAKIPGDAHRPLTDELKKNLSSIFSIHGIRRVNNDYTIQFKTFWFQLSATQKTTIYKNDKVRIEEHSDDTLHILKNEVELTYTKLPERPATVRMKVTALTREKPTWKPPANHPWRNKF